MIYPERRQNLGRARALIVTNSDQLEQLQTIVTVLPKVHFDIAVLTAMSAKLLAFGEHDNVTIYPNISLSRLEALFGDDDILLDINYGDEVLDTVRRAFEQDMLILGFDSTIHQDQYVALQNTFSKGLASRWSTGFSRPWLIQRSSMRWFKNSALKREW